MSTPSTQILVSTPILQQKEAGLPAEISDSTIGIGNIQDEQGATCSVRK